MFTYGAPQDPVLGSVLFTISIFFHLVKYFIYILQWINFSCYANETLLHLSINSDVSFKEIESGSIMLSFL